MPLRKVLQNLDTNSTTELLSQVSQDYGRRKNSTEIEFTKAIGKHFDKTKFLIVFFMIIWVGIVSHSRAFMITFAHQKSVRCIVPPLEGYFSFEEILNLTVRAKDEPYGHYCYYDKRNYEDFVKGHGYNYTALMAAISEAPNTYKEYCPHQLKDKINEVFDDIGEVQNAYDYLELYCQPVVVKRMIDIAMKYGQFLLSVPIGVIGDFYGRRTAFLGSGVLFTIGVILTLVPHVVPVIIGRFFIGSSMILFYTIFVIFIESSHEGLRKKVALLLHEGIVLGRFTAFVLYRLLKHYRRMCIISAAMCVFMLIPYFCIRESPRWLYFNGKQKKAYAFIGQDMPDAPNTLQRKSLRRHFKNFALPVFRKRLMIQMITIWCTSSIVFLIRSEFSRDITNFLLKHLLDSGTFMGLCTVMTFFLMLGIGRGRTIILYFFITSTVGALQFFNPRMDQLINQIALVVSVTLTENATFFAFYMISEFYPTGFRFTGFGLCCGIHGFGDIVHFHAASYKIPLRSLFYSPLFIISSLSLVASHFQVSTAGPFIVADFPRESMRESDYNEIVKNYMYKQRKTPK